MTTLTQTGDQLAETIAAVRDGLGAAAEAPIITVAVDTRQVAGFQTEVQVRGFGLTVDEPPTIGGTDQGPTPVELVLAALGTCQEIVYATYARVLGIPVDGVAVRVEGTLDPRGFFGVADVPVGFQHVSYAVDIRSPASPAAIARLITTVDEHCPVLAILRQPVAVVGSYAHNGEQVRTADERQQVTAA